eukprot:gene42097-51399_t
MLPSRVSRSILTCSRRTFSSHTEPSHIGFIGLGNMGLSMAKNILKNEVGQKHGLVVYDISPQAVQAVTSLGAKSARNVVELAKQCSVIITMLPMTKHVQDTVAVVLENSRKGTLIIDSSTIDPLASQNMQKEAKQRGLIMIDAPVSGGVTGAAAGTLTFMAGGDESALEKARPVLQ